MLPLEQVKEHILQKGSISAEELEQRIRKKMQELAGLISEEGAAHIVANELGVQLLSASMSLKVAHLKPGLRNVDLVGKVLRKFDLREFQTARGPGKVASFVLGDETGTVRAVLWNKQAEQLAKLNEGDVTKIHSAYARDNQGRLELHLNDRSELLVNPEGEKVGAVAAFTEPLRAAAVRKQLAELREGDENVEILVTIVDVFDPHYFSVCPSCAKRVTESGGSTQCAQHGAVQPAVSYVVNVVGDDGSGTMRITLWKNQAERLLRLPQDAMLRFRDAPEQFQDVKHGLLGETVKFAGRVRNNAMFARLEFTVQLVLLDPDPKEELKRLEEAA